MVLLSFHNDAAIKKKYVKRLQEHYNADHIIQGTGWKNGKGCAVGCTLEKYDHKLYPKELGIPVWLAYVEDRIFEGLENSKEKEWPLKFLKAIPVGVELDKIKIPFLIIIVESVLDTFDHKKFPKVLAAITNILNLLKENKINNMNMAYAYVSADASVYVAEVVYATIYAAADDTAAADAADAADAAYAADAAADAADADTGISKKEKYLYFSEKLLELLENCNEN